MRNIIFLLILSSVVLFQTACESISEIPEKVIITYSVTTGSVAEIPNAFRFGPPYPNPFDAEIRIPFAIPVDAFVSVVVQNPLGDVVKVLISQELRAGAYDLDWDGTNERGENVRNGFYFITMTAGAFQHSRIVNKSEELGET